MIGQTVSRYRILSELGGGGMGIVYRAEDPELGRHVALKFLPKEVAADQNALERFLREARAAAALNHPNICAIYEIGRYEGTPFLIMELLEGHTLKTTISGRPLPTDAVLQLGSEVAEALAAAHQKGIVHRDIKPANIFVTREGHAKVLDFGLAKLTPQAGDDDATEALGSDPSDLTSAGSAVGTVAYMSPEQALARPVDARTDLFSLGSVLYEMATGRKAFTGESTAAIFDAILNREPTQASQINPQLPFELEQVIAKALTKEANIRYQTASDLSADLKRLRMHADSSRSSAPMTAPVPPPAAEVAAAAVASASGASAPATEPADISGSSSKIAAIDQAGAKHWKGIVAAVLVLGAGAAAFFAFRGDPEPVLTEGTELVLADFVNTTGDPVFDGTLKQALAVKIAESPYLDVYPQDRIRETLGFMAMEPNAAITQAIGREICQRRGVPALMTGEIAALGSNFILTLNTLDCATGETLAAQQAQAGSKEEVLEALGQAVTGLRRDLGESLASLEKYDAPIEQATTASLEALQAFSKGNIERDIGGDIPAIPFFERAIELDPEFAMAHARLGSALNNQGLSERAAEHITKAFELRDRVSELERLYIEGHYFNNVIGDIDKGTETYELWIRTYPRDWTPYNNVGLNYGNLGQIEKAIAVARKAYELAPEAAFAAGNLAWALVGTGELEEGRQIYEQAREKGHESWGLTMAGVELAELQGERETSEAILAERAGTAGEWFSTYYLSALKARHGELEEARELTRRSVELARRAEASESESQVLSWLAMSEAAFGNFENARELTSRALGLSAGRNARVNALLALAAVADPAEVEAVLDELDERFPRDTLIQSGELPHARAVLQLRAGDAQAALRELEIVRPYELGFPLSIQTRGQVLLALDRPEEAAAEFEKLIEMDASTVVLQPVPRIARLWLGRAHLAAGDAEAARVAYEEFFEQMKNADDGIPLIEKARQEYETIPGVRG
jgi:serine/threonine protein kinase/tetratricopeptide (TPR) repeat protein